MEPKFCVLILDGYGVDPAREDAIAREVLAEMPAEVHARVEKAARVLGVDDVGLLVRPNTASALPVLALQREGRAAEALELSRGLWAAREAWIDALTPAWHQAEVMGRLRLVASRRHYAPWVSSQTFLFAARSTNPTMLTRTSGEDAGFEKLDIEIQGNSDTGHQQMFNLCVAEQMSRQITRALADGRVEELLEPEIRRMAGPNPQRDVLVLKTLLSGEFGDDGYVHSALGHLLEVVGRALKLFAKYEIPSDRLQILAVLDGRDSPPDSSIQAGHKDGRPRWDFLGQLERFLEARGASQCLRFVLGRQYMDRNYRGDLIRREIDLLTGRSWGGGETLTAFRARMQAFDRARDAATALPLVRAADAREAREAIALCHARGLKDSEVPPLVVGQAAPLTGRSIFFNLIYRADRQEPSVAALLGLNDFIRAQAEQKKTWDTWEWLAGAPPLSGLFLASMVDYHAAFSAAGVPFVRPIRPHDHNLLALMAERVPGFRFLLCGEGVKEKHVGLFSRGRRSTPIPGAEARAIIPSYGRADGVNSDDDFWRVPPMKHVEVATTLLARLQADPVPLAAANFPGPDMIGHLVEQHFDACVETLDSLETLLPTLIRGLHALGYVVVLTSDHGNLENFGPDHGINPVLTSFVPPPGLPRALVPVEGVGLAKLYDLPHTMLALAGLTQAVTEGLRYPFPEVDAQGFRAIGRALLQWKES
jgi:bisphosphoglycerate-independent phosphoglycerate mutase (AlkP superfamily)